MSRKTDEEVLKEMEDKIKEDKKKIKELGGKVDDDEDEEAESEEVEKTPNPSPSQVVEREINLALINDKLNYIIAQLPK